MSVFTTDLSGAWIDIANEAEATFTGFNFPHLTITYASNLYVACMVKGRGVGAAALVYVYKSTDGGSTWTALDTANAPTYTSGGSSSAIHYCANFDGLHTWTFALANNLATNPYATMRLKDFDMAAGTWGADYATGGPNVGGEIAAMLRRSDGAFVILYDAGNPLTTGKSGSRLWCVKESAGVYSDDQDAGVNSLATYPTGQVLVSSISAAIDSTDRVHLLYAGGAGSSDWRHSPPPPPAYQPIYQPIDAAMALGTSHAFTDDFRNVDNELPLGRVVIRGSDLVWAVTLAGAGGTAANAGVYVKKGTPLTAPVWSTSVKLDGIGSGDVFDPPAPPGLLYDDTNDVLVLFNVVGDSSLNYPGEIRAMANFSPADVLTGWTPPEIIFDVNVGPLPPDTDPTGGLEVSVFDLTDPGSGVMFSDFLHTTTPAIQSYAYVGKITWAVVAEVFGNDFR